jgi:hypothetical protein
MSEIDAIFARMEAQYDRTDARLQEILNHLD